MGKAIGIDLGTTNSVAAFKLAGVEVVTANDNTPPDRKLTRSVVAAEQGKFLVGEQAYNQIRHDPENVIISIKRIMGRGFGDVAVQKQQSELGAMLHGRSFFFLERLKLNAETCGDFRKLDSNQRATS